MCLNYVTFEGVYCWNSKSLNQGITKHLSWINLHVKLRSLVCGIVEHCVCQMSTSVTMLSRIDPMLTDVF